MKKIFVFLMTLFMICIVPVTVQAANTKITVSNATAEQSQMVYLTVKLSDCAKADTLGISFDYDSSVLKKIASDCSWKEKGVLQDFDIAKDNGVWATNTAKDLNGEICTLAFRVKADAPAGNTDITCQLTVKKDNKTIGTYMAEGTVSVKGDISEDDKQENSEQTKPSTPESAEGAETTDRPEGSDKPEDSSKEEVVVTKPGNSVENNSNKDENTVVSDGSASKDNQNTPTDFNEQQDDTTEDVEEVIGHQHTDACDHDTDEVEDVQGNRIWDMIWLVGALLVGAGSVALIIKKVDKKKK